jgi:mono/diheme cytochrome c family protein
MNPGAACRRAGVALLLYVMPALSGTAFAQPPLPESMIKECAGTALEDCVVRRFKESPEAAMIRGRIVFQSYCVLCHGVTAEGNGRAAKLHNPPPANLVLSKMPAQYFEQIIRKGGEAMGRYRGMPPWGEQLTDEQIGDVIQYLMSVRRPD